MPVAEQALGQGQSLANGVDRLVVAAGDNTVGLGEQRRFEGFIAAIPLRDFERRRQAWFDVVQRVPE